LNRVQQSPIGKRIVSGTFWSVVGNGFGKMFTFIAMIFVARILGKEAFGEFGLVRSTAMTFVTFSSFGIGLTATKYIAELLHSDKERVGRIIGLNYLLSFFMSLIITVIFYFSIPGLCKLVLNAPNLVNEMRWGALSLFLMTFMSTQVGIMLGFQDFKGQASVALIVGFVAIPAYFIGAKFSGLHGTILALLFVTLTNVIINSIFIFSNIKKRGLRYSFGDAYKELPILWKFSLPVVLCSIIPSTGLWICQMIQRSQPNGAGELGLYFALMSLYSIVMFLPNMFINVMIPMTSEIQSQHNSIRFRKIIIVHSCFNIFIVSIIIFPIMFFSRQVMMCFGNEFIIDFKIMFLFGIYCLLSAFLGIICMIMVSTGHAWFNFITIIIGTVTMLCFAYPFITHLGTLGLFLTMIMDVLARSVFCVICILFLSQQFSIKSKSSSNL
jgi:O-antigen/teichoic acid export membrane protein